MSHRDGELDSLIHAWLDGTASDADGARLNDRLRTDPEARTLYLQLADMHSCLAVDEAFWAPAAQAVVPPSNPSRPTWRQWRPLGAAAAGLVIGLGTGTLVWGFAAERPVSTAAAVVALADGGFEKDAGPVAAGFPAQASLWSGDDLEITGAAKNAQGTTINPTQGRSMLRFVRPAGDAATPKGRAISCDVFQIVDLRPLRESIPSGSDAVLELAADVLDARLFPKVPATFLCKVFTFQGDSASLHQVWPAPADTALSLGSALQGSAGGLPDAWKTLTTRCLLPPEADFAVIHLGARRDGPLESFDALYADNVRLTLKTQPRLPVRSNSR
jgi:hypothetical protein